MTTLQDEETLRKGLVWVFYNLINREIDKKLMDPIYRVESCFPPRVSAVHYCYTDEKMRPFVTGMQLFLADHDRVRLRQHLGTREEIQFKLQTYGIPIEAGPMKQDGTWSLTWLHEWLRTQETREQKEQKQEVVKALDSSSTSEDEAPQDKDLIVVPRRFDVIIGKTSLARVHTGNRRAIHLCDMYFEAYEAASKFKKTEVTEMIVSIIRKSGGRFVKWEDAEGWVEEHDELIARKKIGHFLRYMRSKVKNMDVQASGTKRSVESKSDEDCEKSTVARVTPPASPR